MQIIMQNRQKYGKTESTMIYETMIKTENSDSMRDQWSEYRQALTEYIRDGIESFFRREYLSQEGLLRDHTFRLKEVKEGILPGKKPVVAVWGAGGCNDLDLLALAPYVDFVLIDRDVDAMQKAAKRFGFTEGQCQCVDIGFWEIYEEEERFFDALLKDADDLHLSEYLRQLMDSVLKQEMMPASYENAFDFSIVCGIASQLNARFVGLVQGHGKDLKSLPQTVAAMQDMNVQAEKRLYGVVEFMTRCAFFTANEMCAAKPEAHGRLQEYAQIWTEEWERLLVTQAGVQEIPMEMDGISCEVAGSREFIEEILKAQREGMLKIRHRRGMVWPFSAEKHYFMDVLTAYFINKEIK